jgi:hypothetical protein
MPRLSPRPIGIPTRRARHRLRLDETLERQVLAAFGEVAGAYASETAARRLVQSGVNVMFVEADEGGALMPGGSILVATGKSRDRMYRALTKAASTGDAVRVSDVVARWLDGLDSRRTQDLALPAYPAGRLSEIPVLTDVAYRGRVIAQAQVVGDGHGVSISRLPFTGGELDPAGFSANQFHASADPGFEVESLAIVREPRLTALEQRVLAEFPAELSQERLGSPGSVANWGLVAAAAVFVFVVVAGVYLAREAQREIQEAQQQREQEQQQQDAGQDQAQDAGQDQEQDAGQDQQQEDDGGSLSQWLDRTELGAQLEQLEARAAVGTLLQLRTQLLVSRHIG